MKINKLKRFFRKPRSYTVVVLIILTVISLVEIFGFCIKDLNSILIEKFFVTEKLLAELYEIASIWVVGLIFIIFGLIIDISRYQTRKLSLSKIDFDNDKEIYREILKKYSVLGLIYIDDFKENIYKYAVTLLLNLEVKNKIAIKDNGIEIIDRTNLRQSEMYAMLRIKDGRFGIENPKEFISLAKKDGIEDGLVEKNPEKRNKLKNKTTQELVKKGIKNAVLTLVAALIFILIMVVLDFFSEGSPIGYLFDIIFMMLPLFAILFLFGNYLAYEININKVSCRTELGEYINEKLEGLKNYIKEYSYLNEKEKEYLNLWDEYLIYSVMFNQNEKILYDVGRHIYYKR